MSQLAFFIQGVPGTGTVTSISEANGITLTPNPITSSGTVAISGIVPTSFVTDDTNSATTTTNIINVAGGGGITTTSTGNTITITNAETQGIVTIHGDTGAITGTSVTIYAHNAVQNAGSSVRFINSGTVSTFTVTDSNSNTLIGVDAGNGTLSGTVNVGLGDHALNLITTASNNVALGSTTLNNLLTGNFNVAVGDASGAQYMAAESSNILLNYTGVLSENNTLHISSSGAGNQQLSRAFIGGIFGVNAGSTANVVTSVSNDQLGTAAITAGAGISVTPGANTITIAATGGGSGALVLIQTQTAASSTALTFTTGITSTYNHYYLLYDNVTTAAGNIVAQLSTNGGATYITTGYGGNSTLGLTLAFPTATQIAYGEVNLLNMTSGVNYVVNDYTFNFVDTVGPSVSNNNANSAYLTPTIVVNAFQIVNDTAIVFSGKFSLYGIVQ